MPDPIILDDTMSSGGKLRPGVIRHTSAGIFTATLATSRIHKQPRGLQSKYLLCSANGDFLLAVFGPRWMWNIATLLATRAGHEGPQNFHNHGEGPYQQLGPSASLLLSHLGIYQETMLNGR